MAVRATRADAPLDPAGPSDYNYAMAHPRRFRFGIDLQTPLEGSSWSDSAREAEALGYSTMFVPDHFDEGIGPIAAMATAAAVTTTLNVGALVLDCDFRHPAVLARELATIDQLSAGRLEVGLGAGWKRRRTASRRFVRSIKKESSRRRRIAVTTSR